MNNFDQSNFIEFSRKTNESTIVTILNINYFRESLKVILLKN